MGKFVQTSQNAYREIKDILDKFYSQSTSGRDTFDLIYKLLTKYNISLRQDDGSEPIMTFSVAKSEEAIVVGIRYEKQDGSKTEDHFIFRPNTNLYKCKGKEIDKLIPEYKGTHKLQR